VRLSIIRGISSVGRASALQAECHRFDPGILHQLSPIFGYCVALADLGTNCGCSSGVELFVANEVVVSSNLTIRSKICEVRYILGRDLIYTGLYGKGAKYR
jgi:hypothetical protein